MTAIAKQLGLAQTLSLSRIVTKLKEFHENIDQSTHTSTEAISAEVVTQIKELPENPSAEITNETPEPISEAVVSE
jgi:hypothetical protein